MDNKGFTLRKRLGSFKYALSGIKTLILGEANAWIHCFVTVCVVVAGFLLDISTMEWIAVVTLIGAVFAAEGLNTAIERLADVVSPEYNTGIKQAKDLSAGAVLFIAVAAVIVGAIIFLPKVIYVLSPLSRGAGGV